jgi:hypothetical protein
MKRQRSDNDIHIRVITPSTARTVTNIRDIGLFDNGSPTSISLGTSLRQLKHMIASHLSVTIKLPSQAYASECNCIFARSVAKYGLWDMLRGREPLSGTFPYEDMDLSCDCLICMIPLHQSCQGCTSLNDCPLVRNSGCSHVFHRDCFVQYAGMNCPGGCSTGMRCDSNVNGRCHTARDGSCFWTSWATSDHR